MTFGLQVPTVGDHQVVYPLTFLSTWVAQHKAICWRGIGLRTIGRLYRTPRLSANQRKYRRDDIAQEPDIELESYFEFTSPEEIRIKGTRIGIETVLEDYLEGASPDEIAVRYGSLTLEQVYACLLYYLQNQAQIDAYLEAGRACTEQAWLEQQQNPSPAIRRLRELKAQRAALLGKQATP